MAAQCPLFGTCGGCMTQHIPYEVQVENKRQFVHDAVKRSGISILNSDVTLVHDKPFSYRNRMDFAFCADGLALRKKGKWDKLVHVTQCPIANQKLNALLKEIQHWFDAHKEKLDVFDLRKKTGTLRYAVIRTPEFSDDCSISFVLNEHASNLASHVDLIKSFAQSCSATHVVVTYCPRDSDLSITGDYFIVKGTDRIIEKTADCTYSFAVQGFMQNNSVMSDKLVRYCRDVFSEHETKNAFLLDLYGGVGLFGVACAPLFFEVLVAESFAESVKGAEDNAQRNGYSNVSGVCIDVKQLPKLDIPNRIGDKKLFVLTDPPRSGMHPKAVKYLMLLEPEVIVYVSCNPAQLSKELVVFKSHYDVAQMAAFDLFPQTNHVEAVVVLNKKHS